MAKWAMVIDLDKCGRMPGVRCRLQGREQRPTWIARGAEVEEEIYWHSMIAATKGKYPHVRTEIIPCLACSVIILPVSRSARQRLPFQRTMASSPSITEDASAASTAWWPVLTGRGASITRSRNKTLSPPGRASGSRVLGPCHFPREHKAWWKNAPSVSTGSIRDSRKEKRSG